MKNAALFTVTLFCFAIAAHATNLSGSWQGAGQAVDNQGKTTNCESVAFTFTQTATSLTLSSAFTCAGNPLTIPGGTLEIRGADLYDAKGVKSGSISDTAITVVAKDKGYMMQSNATFTDAAMNLRAVVNVGTNPLPALTFEATLHR